MHMEEQCTGVSRDGGKKSSTREGTGPNKKRIIPGTDNQWGDEERRMRNALEFSALLFLILFVIEFMMCYSCPAHSGWGGVRLCAALRGVAEAKDAGSRRVHPLPRPCSQLGG